MRIRAAVLEEFGAAARRAGGRPGRAQGGRGARPARGLRRLPHRHVHRLGRRPVRLRARVLGHEGAGRRRGARRGRHGPRSRRPRGHAVLAAVPRVRPLPRARDEPLHGDPRRAEPRPPARRHGRACARRRADPPLHGHEHVRRVHGDAGDRAGQGRPRRRRWTAARCSPAASRPASARRCTPRRWRRAPPCVVFGAGMVGLGAVAGARLQGAERIICVDLSEDRLELAKGHGATDTLDRRRRTPSQRILDETGGFGADYTFEATGIVSVMRQAVESARMGWGLCTVAGVAGKGETLDIVPRYLIQGRRVSGSSFGGVKGRDQVPQLVAALSRRRPRRRPVHLAPDHARRGQPRLRADARPGRDPERDRVLTLGRTLHAN